MTDEKGKSDRLIIVPSDTVVLLLNQPKRFLD